MQVSRFLTLRSVHPPTGRVKAKQFHSKHVLSRNSPLRNLRSSSRQSPRRQSNVSQLRPSFTIIGFPVSNSISSKTSAYRFVSPQISMIRSPYDSMNNIVALPEDTRLISTPPEYAHAFNLFKQLRSDGHRLDLRLYKIGCPSF